jgi:hypothetical protein
VVEKIKVAYICPLFDDDKKGKKNIFIEDCSLKILDDIAWFKGKSLSFIYILTLGEVCAY